MKRVAYLKYVNSGVGNRLFQYVYTRLHCENNNYIFLQQGIPELDIESTMDSNLKIDIVMDNPQGFLQNPKLYENDLQRIKNWDCFEDIKPLDINENDLVIHLRAGNRMLNRNAKYSAMADVLGGFLNRIDFEQLHIVTNLKKHTEWCLDDILEEIENLKKNGGSGEPPETYQNPNYAFLEPEESLQVTNSFIRVLNNYNPIWVSGSIKEDFNYLRKFRKILFPRSTLSWWAAATGVANEVYVYGPWMPNKPHLLLGKTNYRGWQPWGE